jgi:hypothetical protein
MLSYFTFCIKKKKLQRLLSNEVTKRDTNVSFNFFFFKIACFVSIKCRIYLDMQYFSAMQQWGKIYVHSGAIYSHLYCCFSSFFCILQMKINFKLNAVFAEIEINLKIITMSAIAFSQFVLFLHP